MTCQRLDAAQVDSVVDVLCDAFHDYPVMRFVLGSPPDYDERLHKLVNFFVMARVHRDEIMLGIPDDQGLAAAALVSFPGRDQEEPDALADLRETTWAELGDEPRERYEAFGAACGPLIPSDYHVHLNMIGARRGEQGKGHARVLMDAVHEISASDEGSSGVTLTTENEANVPLYQHLGYEIQGRADVSPTLTTWALFRPDPG